MKKFLKFVLGLLVFCALIGLVIFGMKGFGFGLGAGSGGNGNRNHNQVSEDSTTEEATIENEYVTIKVDETTIYVNDEICNSIAELKDKIGKLEAEGKSKKYRYENEFAIKESDDEVKTALYELQDTLGIKVEFED